MVLIWPGLAQLACAIAGSREREMETCMLGQAFLQAIADYGIPCPMTAEKLAYPVAVGPVAAAARIGLMAVATAYLHAFVANMIQAGLRLIPLRQKSGLRLMHVLEGDILALSRKAPHLTLADLGSSLPLYQTFAPCGMKHFIQGIFAHDFSFF